MNRSVAFITILWFVFWGHSNAQGALPLPLSFEANQGQIDSGVRYFARGPGYSLYLTNEEAVIALRDQTTPIRMRLEGSAPGDPAGEERLPGADSYFIGNDPLRWHANIPTWAKVRYRGVYPGVDLIYYGRQAQLEYDLVVAPGGDPRSIRLRFTGASRLRTTPKGDLLVSAEGGALVFPRPAIYQLANGRRTPVSGAFALLGRRTVGFRLGRYDRLQPLVIDPVLAYSTYLGGSASDAATAIVADPEGNVYITGVATSPDFPVSPGAYQSTNRSTGGGANVFVSKLNAAGTALLYSTYLGGSAFDQAGALAVDNSGNAWIAGATGSSDFPVTRGALQTTLSTGAGFVTKLNPNGSALVYSTYVGGDVSALAVDGAGNAYITGNTSSADFPVTPGAFQTQSKACCGPFVSSPFVSKLNPAGSALVYSTFLGGSGICAFSIGPQQYVGDATRGLAVDNAGNAYIAGATSSADFPVTAGAFQTKNKAFHYDHGGICPGAPGFNAFVTKLNAAGTALVYSTYLGGSGRDLAMGLALDSSGNAYIAGQTSSSDFPATPGAIQTANRSRSGGNAFLTRLDPSGSSQIYSTYLGGTGADTANATAVDSSGNAYVTGNSSSADFPLTPGAVQTANRSTARGTSFLAAINPAGNSLFYSTYLGGTGSDFGNALALDDSGNAWVAGSTTSADFPVTSAALQASNRSASGGSNAFVAKLPVVPAPPAPSITPGRVVPIYSGVNTIQSGEWISIFGANLAAATAIWDGNFPTSLGGASVTINGKAAYLIYAGPTQINLQAPSDTATGPVQVVVTTQGGSAASTVTLAPFAPSFCLFDTRHVAGIILRPDGSGSQGGGSYDILGPTGSSLGYPAVAARAGDAVALFGTGLGPTNPAPPAGQSFSGAARTTNPVTLSMNGVTVIPSFAGLSSAGLYQMNVVIPAGLGTGDVPLLALVGGVQTPAGVVISLQ
jgi:uncharacterized protein (TIGR03437 family)